MFLRLFTSYFFRRDRKLSICFLVILSTTSFLSRSNSATTLVTYSPKPSCLTKQNTSLATAWFIQTYRVSCMQCKSENEILAKNIIWPSVVIVKGKNQGTERGRANLNHLCVLWWNRKSRRWDETVVSDSLCPSTWMKFVTVQSDDQWSENIVNGLFGGGYVQVFHARHCIYSKYHIVTFKSLKSFLRVWLPSLFRKSRISPSVLRIKLS